MRWFWGLLLIFLGLIILGSNFGWWNWSQIANLTVLWPLIIILFGIAILVRNVSFGWIILLVAFLLALASIVALPSKFSNRFINSVEPKTTNFSQNLGEQVKSGQIDIHTGASKLNFLDETDKFVEGSLESNITNPEIQITQSNDKATASINTTSRGQIHCCGNFKNELNVKATNKIPLDINIESGASNINLNLSKILLKSLNVETGMSSLSMQLGETIADDAKIVIKAGASSVEIIAPESLGIEIQANSGASNKELDNFQKINDRLYRTDNFDQAQKKVYITFESGMSVIRVERK